MEGDPNSGGADRLVQPVPERWSTGRALIQHSGPCTLGGFAASPYVAPMQTHMPIQLLDDEAIGGPILGADHHHVKTFPCDRVCEHEGCSTRLSMYNSGSLCVVHDERGVSLYVHAFPAASRRAVRSPHRAA